LAGELCFNRSESGGDGDAMSAGEIGDHAGEALPSAERGGKADSERMSEPESQETNERITRLAGFVFRCSFEAPPRRPAPIRTFS